MAAASSLDYDRGRENLGYIAFSVEMPSVKHCARGLCKSDSRYPHKFPGVKFIPFAEPGVHGYLSRA